ncbi:NADP-dependent oxidoreductase [Rhodococcus pyridinivorans]|uniref:NADP-dependent oxidoreductase n=1 Tax=Rhodococcus TaxID=1827 RepID=UPI000904047C|nr:NADP-dependent oxidoreductase [Rhodococcus sp. 2G]APE10490.1 hypothetical protein BO226_15830 [Rhodococcus sp. 2G]
MSADRNTVVRVRAVPVGIPTEADFEIAEEPMPVLDSDGTVLFRATHMSLDPVMRRYLPATDTGAGPIGGTAAVGDIAMAAPPPPYHPMVGAFVGEVLESRDSRFLPGDRIRGGHLWQTHHVVPGDCVQPVEHDNPLEELGLLGMPGMVAWCGIRVADLRPDETFVVSAAGGAIGMLAGQLAKAAGARVIGIASGEKASYVVDSLGFDAAIDRRATDVGSELDRLCPDGIDVYFENVGGDVGRAVFDRLRDHGRYIVCGMAGEYNGPEPQAGPPMRPVLRKRLRIEGFVVYDHFDDLPEFRSQIREVHHSGEIHYRYETVSGLAAAPSALGRLLRGENRGKIVVELD